MVDKSNKNENNFCIISGPGGLLKLDIMVPKANVLTFLTELSHNKNKGINLHVGVCI